MFILTSALTLTYSLFDKCVKKEARWYFIHSLANLFILTYTYKDVYNTFTHPTPLICKSTIPINIMNSVITSLHSYHLIFYTNLKLDDYIHHIVMIIIFNLSILQVKGSYPGSFLFFMNGLPGFIDYSLLFLNKYNMVTKINEKYINTFLNVYIRSPGILLTIGNLLSNVENKSFLSYFNLFFIFFNSQYYTRDVCINYGTKNKIK